MLHNVHSGYGMWREDLRGDDLQNKEGCRVAAAFFSPLALDERQQISIKHVRIDGQHAM